MIELSMDMEQYDCPFIDTTADHAVTFSAYQWEFDQAERTLETRMTVEGSDRGALENGLQAVSSHANMADIDLLSKQESVAHIRTAIEETDAMRTIRRNDGYITGPFHVEDGSETWHVGFDRSERADETLSSLDRNNEFSVIEREDFSTADLSGVVQRAGAAMALIEGCKDLSDTERRTLETAVSEGYFETPREADLGALASEFDVSKPAVSKTLRRGQRKTMSRIVETLEELDERE
jgi:predicted DNA binding protein